jgi:hypothetical protein
LQSQRAKQDEENMRNENIQEQQQQTNNKKETSPVPDVEAVVERKVVGKQVSKSQNIY